MPDATVERRLLVPIVLRQEIGERAVGVCDSSPPRDSRSWRRRRHTRRRCRETCSNDPPSNEPETSGASVGLARFVKICTTEVIASAPHSDDCAPRSTSTRSISPAAIRLKSKRPPSRLARTPSIEHDVVVRVAAPHEQGRRAAAFPACALDAGAGHEAENVGELGRAERLDVGAADDRQRLRDATLGSPGRARRSRPACRTASRSDSATSLRDDRRSRRRLGDVIGKSACAACVSANGVRGGTVQLVRAARRRSSFSQ